MNRVDDFCVDGDDSVCDFLGAASTPLGLMDGLMSPSKRQDSQDRVAPRRQEALELLTPLKLNETTLSHPSMGMALNSPVSSDISTGLTSSSSRPCSLTPARKTMIEDVFFHFTCHNKDSIATADLAMALRFLGHKLSGQQLERVIEETDKDGGGEVDFEEFLATAEQLDEFHSSAYGASSSSDQRILPTRSQTRREWLMAIFSKFAHNNETIVQKHWLDALCHAGHRLSPNQVLILAKEFDEDGGGELDFDEFEAMVKKLDGEGSPLAIVA